MLVFFTLLNGHPSRDKRIVIKIIKRKVTPELPCTVSTKRPKAHPATVTETVNDWIAESRRNRLDQDSSSRKMIASWTAEVNV